MKSLAVPWVAALVIAISLADGGARADGDAPSPSSAAPSAVDIDAALAPLGDPSIDTRRAAAKRASELDAPALPAIAKKLSELRASSAGAMATVMRAVRDQSGARANDKAFDLVEALLSMSRGDAAAVRATLTEACLLRSLEHIGSTAASRHLVNASSDAGGAFRAEVTRRVSALGDRAVPALIEARLQPDARAWAAGMLEALGKHLPSDAVQASSDDVLCDVLRAYGTVRDLDAVRVILSFASSDRAPVRTAARDALLAYGNDGAWIVREAYAAAAGKPADEAWNGEQLDKALFQTLDRARLQEVYAVLDDGLAKERAGQLDAAIVNFDKVLARQPMLDRRGEMVAGYLAYARSLEDRDRPQALAYLRRAARLDENGARAKEVESEVVYLEAEDLLARGVVDSEAFRRAIALDPSNVRASSELARIDGERDAKASSARFWAAAAIAFAALVVAAILFVGRGGQARSRRRSPAK